MADTTGIDWQRQSFAKGGKAETAPSQMNPKTWGGPASSLNAKIAKPTHPCGGMVKGGMANGGMVKAYADGGTMSDGEWMRGENYGDGTTGDERVAMARDPNYTAPADTTPLPEPEPVKAEEAAPEPKRESFKEAFARNRAAGAKTFEWNGKKYTTEMAGASKPRAAAKVIDTGDETERLKARSARSVPSTAARPVASNPSSRLVTDKFDPSKVDSKTLLPKR